MNIDINGDREVRAIHFIGIGGIQMKALAALMHMEGFAVSGSDRNESEAIRGLVRQGITVHIGHAAAHIPNAADLVVYTAAVKSDNPEYAAALARGLPMLDRAAFLGLLMRNYEYPVCVAGTHGKTSTTSMLSEILIQAGMDPTVMNGGDLASIGGSLRRGGRRYLAAEACEYCDSFLRLFPRVGIILNIEYDHADYFPTIEAVRASFRRFAGLIPHDGALIINAGIEGLEELTAGLDCAVATFGEGGDFRAEDIVYDEDGCPAFTLICRGEKLCEVSMGVPGLHNIHNALAACAAACELGATPEALAEGLAGFTGAARRYQPKGEFNGCRVFDDYAHLPSEIRTTLASAKNSRHNRLYCVFQPHTHTRTRALMEDFADSFGDCDTAVILDIYSPAGREEEDCPVHSRELAERLRDRGMDAHYLPGFDEAAAFLCERCINNDLLITMGAGDVYIVGERLVSACQ